MSNCLIDQTGKVVECTGGVHDIPCRQQLKMTLAKFLKSGGARVKIRHDIAAIEFYGCMSAKQNSIINGLLKQQPIYVIVMPFKTVTKFRPIRSFVFKGSLVPK